MDNLTKETMMTDAKTNAREAFIQADNNTWMSKHNPYNGHHPIQGNGAGSGSLGIHTAKRHDDVYGKDVNGIGLGPFEPSYGEEQDADENFAGDHALWYKGFRTGYVEWQDQEYEDDMWVKDAEMHDNDVVQDYMRDEAWQVGLAKREEAWQGAVENDDEDALWERHYDRTVAATLTVWEARYLEEGRIHELERDLDARYGAGMSKYFYLNADLDEFKMWRKTNRKEQNRLAREAGMVKNPRWFKGSVQEPYHIPAGAVFTKADVRVCLPSKGRCECTKPILQRVKRMPWGGYDKNSRGFGGWKHVVCVTNEDIKKACYKKPWWGKKTVSVIAPQITRRKIGWHAPKPKTPKAEPQKPEQRVETPVQQRRKRIIGW